jgi:hypothetical protein
MTGRRTPRAPAEAVAGLMAVGVAVASLAGCSSTPATPPPPAAPATSPMPTRPVVLRLDQEGNDPCGLLSAAQVSQLGASPGTRSAVAGEPDSYDCLWMRNPATLDGSWFARADLRHDAAYYLSSSAQIVQVSGFGTVQTASGLGERDTNCQLYVDAAPEQSLEVQYATLRGGAGINHQLACQLASQAAEQMLANLRTASGTG